MPLSRSGILSWREQQGRNTSLLASPNISKSLLRFLAFEAAGGGVSDLGRTTQHWSLTAVSAKLPSLDPPTFLASHLIAFFSFVSFFLSPDARTRTFPLFSPQFYFSAGISFSERLFAVLKEGAIFALISRRSLGTGGGGRGGFSPG